MQPVHNLTGCHRCRIYHCSVCGCPRDNRVAPNFPNTEVGNMAFVEHRLPTEHRVVLDRIALAGIAIVDQERRRARLSEMTP